ncbi:MAG: hypothetical protein ACJ78M_03290, partial [Gemmatimonadaceae bacterium]
EGAKYENFRAPEIGLIVSAEYYYRRHLGAKDLLPAIGVGVAAGLAGFYVVQLLIQRTPLVPQGELTRARTTPPKRVLGARTEPETETHYARELPPGQPAGARARQE